MRTKLECCSALITFVLLAAGSDSLLAGEPKPLPRSLYVPVAFRTCEHLKGATLFIGDQPVGTLSIMKESVPTPQPLTPWLGGGYVVPSRRGGRAAARFDQP